ncbi:protein kinase [Spirillospora sp. NBC_00431]
MSDDVPSLVAGYRDLVLVHRGAGAVTYRAVAERSGVAVALRVQRGGVDIPPDELESLRRASQNPHMVTVLETGRTASERRFTALQYCGGGGYGDGGPLAVREAVEVAIAVGKALQALHDEGLVHGDVHPGRVLRGEDGPLLSGAATLRGLAARSRPGVLEPPDLERVDPGHAAPETLRRQEQTVASDVYGLGATLWSLLAGHAPFTGDGPGAIRERALAGPVPALPRTDVPERLVEAVTTAMAPEPAERHASAGVFVRVLEEILPEAPESSWSRLPGWAWESGGAERPEAGAGAGAEAAARGRDEAAAQAPGVRASRGIGPVVATVAALLVVGAVVGVMGLLPEGDDGERARAQPSRDRVPTSTPTAVREDGKYRPGKVRITDARISIEVGWDDRSGGTATHYVVGGPRGRTASTLATARPGTEKVVVTALNPGVDYCLTVVAVLDVDRVAHAEPVCTRRVKRDG